MTKIKTMKSGLSDKYWAVTGNVNSSDWDISTPLVDTEAEAIDMLVEVLTKLNIEFTLD